MFVEAAADASHVVSSYGEVGFLGLLAIEGVRFLSALRKKWDRDFALRKALANQQIVTFKQLTKAVLQVARAVQRPEDRDTVPLELPVEDTSPIDVALARVAGDSENSGPIPLQ